MRILSDAIVPDVAAPSSTIWIALGIVAAVFAVLAGAAVLIVLLVKRRKRKRQ